MRAVAMTGYHPNRLARNLRERSARILALVVSDITNPFFTSILRGFDDRARAAGYSVIVTNTDELVELESQRLLDLVSERVAGIVLASTGEASDGLAQAVRSGIPIVALDRRIKAGRFDMVTTDGIAAASDAVERLLVAGHRRIAFIGGPPEISAMTERREGFEAALRGKGLRPDEVLIRFGDLREDSGSSALSELLDAPDPPTAVLVASNLMAIGALKAIRARGLTVPDDISVICFDDVVGGELIGPGIAAVLQPTYEMGAAAAGLLLRRIADPSAPIEESILPTAMVPRGSIGAVA